MSKIKIGNKVKVHYVGTLEDGNEFDSSVKREKPLEFVIGEGKMIPGFENAIRSMDVGEKKNVKIEPKEGYGDINPEAEMVVPRTDFPDNFRFIIDETIKGKRKDGQPAMAKIVEVTKKEVMLDMNHPLAGKELNFEIELLEIEK
jgi:peptidylprolyl isomerase